MPTPKERARAARQRRKRLAEGGAEPAKCEALKADGTPCGQTATPGATTCHRHRAGRRSRPGDVPREDVPRGIYNRHLSEQGRRTIAALQTDPELLNPRRAVAVGEWLLEHAVFEPTPETVLELAREMFPGDDKHRRWEADDFTAHELALARVQLVDRMQKLLARHSRMVEGAHKVAKLDEIMQAGALPALQRLARMFLVLGDRYVPADKIAAFREDLKGAVTSAIGQITQAATDGGDE